jgi:hypothetical protein
MAFYDHLARDPKTMNEFWKIIEETFEQVEPTLTAYPVETREEALEPQRFFPGVAIRYRGASEEYDSRDYFLKLGRKCVPRVKMQIKSRQLTPKFAKDWGVVMMCHGFIAAHVLDDSDALSQVRAGKSSAKIRSKDAQRRWVARQILAIMKSGRTRVEADRILGTRIADLIEYGKFPPRFEKWFRAMLDKNEALRDAYGQKRLSESDLKELASQPGDDLPSINFSH